jgi:hypothetical protein
MIIMAYICDSMFAWIERFKKDFRAKILFYYKITNLKAVHPLVGPLAITVIPQAVLPVRGYVSMQLYRKCGSDDSNDSKCTGTAPG